MKSDFGFDVQNKPTVSLVLTINNRTPEVSKAVADSFRLPGNELDEAVIVLDRPTQEARSGATEAWSDMPWPVKYVEIEGPQGWICPAKAWNAAYEAATSDLLYQISSEVVQDAGNVEKMRHLCADGNTCAFGACHNSEAIQMVTGAEPGLLASSKLPRPLGFIVCYPRDKMLSIGGNDLEFMKGLWYEDDDLFARLWQVGVDFCFDDAVHGVHLHHERPGLGTPEGQAKTQINAAYLQKKWGTLQPFSQMLRMEERKDGRTWWRHLT